MRNRSTLLSSAWYGPVLSGCRGRQTHDISIWLIHGSCLRNAERNPSLHHRACSSLLGYCERLWRLAEPTRLSQFERHRIPPGISHLYCMAGNAFPKVLGETLPGDTRVCPGVSQRARLGIESTPSIRHSPTTRQTGLVA